MQLFKKAQKFDMYAGQVMLIALAFASIALVPLATLPITEVKGFILVIAGLIALMLWLIARLIDGTFFLPKTKWMLLYPALLLASTFATAFSSQVRESFVANFETTTFLVFLSALTFSFISLTFFRRARHIKWLYVTLIGACALTGLLAFVRIALQGVPTLGVFSHITDTLVGSWSDFGMLTALASILTLVTLEFLPLQRRKKTIAILLLSATLFLAVFINTALAWTCIAGGSLLCILFSVFISNHILRSRADGNAQIVTPLGALIENHRAPLYALVTLILSLFFLATQGGLANKIPGAFGVSYTEVRPSLVSTLATGTRDIKEHPLFGEGLSRFSVTWSQHKPTKILETQFWNVEFGVGSGYIPTMMATSGIVGAIAWLVAALLVAAFFVKRLVYPLEMDENKRREYLFVSSYILGLISFLALFFAMPGTLLLMIFVILISMFIGNYCIPASLWTSFSILQNKKVAYSSLALLFICLMLVVGGAYTAVRAGTAEAYAKIAVLRAAQGKIAQSENYFLRSDALAPSDVTSQGLSQIAFASINALLKEQNPEDETTKSALKNAFSLAEQNAVQAVAYDKRTYSNWVFLGDLYKAFMQLGITNAYESAGMAYQEALKLVPHNPAVLLHLADLERAHGNTEQARVYAQSALREKPDYVDAFLFLATLEQALGNIDQAHELESQASQIDPNNAELFYQLGLIARDADEKGRAIDFLEQAVALNPQYSNARFMLAVMYDGAGRKEDALMQLAILQQENPGNAELEEVISRVKAGQSILTSNSAETISVEGGEEVSVDDTASL